MMRKKVRPTLYFISGLSWLALSACGRGPQSSEPLAIVSQQQADRAFKVVFKVDYLPFNYIEDGCYARELYMAMELAAEEIPSSAHYIYGYLRPTADTRWTYHVAPMLKVGSDEPWVLDPSFEASPLRVGDWIEKNFPKGRFTISIKAGSAYFDSKGRTSEFDADHLVSSFKEMPTFLGSDIASACTVMYNYIAKEDEDVVYKRTKLLNRTAELVQDLTQVGKFEKTSLGRQVNARCREAISIGSKID